MSPLNPLYDHLDSSSTPAMQTTTSDLTDLLNIIRNENSHKKEKVDRFLRHLCVLIQIILGYREVTRTLHKTSRWYREFVCQLDGAKDLLKHLGFADDGELLSPPTEHQYNLRQFTKIEPVAPFFQSNTDVLDHTSPSSINRETPGLSNHPPQGSLSTSFSHQGTSPLRSAMNAARSLRMTPGAVMSPRGSSFLHQERVHQQVKPAPSSLTGQLPPRGSAARLSSENKQLQKKLHNLEAQIHDIVIANEELEQENKRRRVAEHELHSAKIKYEQINEAYIMTQHKNTELETECGRLQDILTRDRQFYMLGLMGDKRTPFPPGHPYEKQFDDPDELNSVVYPHSFDHGTLVEGDEDDDELEDELHGHSAGSLERMRKKKSVPDEVERPLAPFGGLQQEILNGWRKTRKRNKELEQESNECQETIRELERMVSKLKKSRTSAEREVKLLRRTLKSRHGKMRGPTKTRENEEATSTDSTLDGDTTDEKGNGKSDPPLSSDDGGQVDPSLFHETLAQPKRPPPKVSQLTASVRKRQRELKEQEGKFAPNGQKPARKRAQSTETNSPSEERELSSRQNKRKRRKSKSGRTNQSDSSEWNEHYYHDPSDDPEDLDAREMAANVPTKPTRGNVPADLLNKRSRQKNRTRPPKPQKQPKLHKTKNRTKMNGAGGNAKQQKKEDLYIDRVSPKKPATNPNAFEQSHMRQKEIETHGRLIEKIIRKDELLQHERTKNRELRNTVTEVYHRQWSADNKLNILGTPQKLRGIHLGNSVQNPRHRKDSHSQSSLEEIGIERDCVLRLFSHDRTATRIRVCVNDDEFQDVDAFVVEDDGLSLIRDVVSPLTRNCLENGGTSLLCVCVGIKKVDVGLLSPKLRGVVKIILEDVLVKKEVTMTQFDSVLKSWNASEEKRDQQEDVLETLMVSSSEAQTSERMNVLSCRFENGGRLHIVCSNLSYEQFMFVEDERQVVKVLRNYVPYAGPLHFDGDTSPAVAVVAHVNHAQRVVHPKTDV